MILCRIFFTLIVSCTVLRDQNGFSAQVESRGRLITVESHTAVNSFPVKSEGRRYTVGLEVRKGVLVTIVSKANIVDNAISMISKP